MPGSFLGPPGDPPDDQYPDEPWPEEPSCKAHNGVFTKGCGLCELAAVEWEMEEAARRAEQAYDEAGDRAYDAQLEARHG